MIPKVINYIFGLDENYCNKPFCDFHYFNILSSKLINPDYTINIYYFNKPTSNLFNSLKNFCNLIKLEKVPREISNKKFEFTEHICDLLRIELIYNVGGIYLDIDTVCINSFDSLLENECVMGLEYGKHEHEHIPKLIGLCNAVVMGEKHNIFIEKWIENFYKDYRTDWNYNCVQMPYNLSKIYKSHITIQPQNSFFKYSWDSEGRNNLFFNNSDVNDCFSLHLWESKNFEILKKYDYKYVLNNKDTLSNIYKKCL